MNFKVGDKFQVVDRVHAKVVVTVDYVDDMEVKFSSTAPFNFIVPDGILTSSSVRYNRSCDCAIECWILNHYKPAAFVLIATQRILNDALKSPCFKLVPL